MNTRHHDLRKWPAQTAWWKNSTIAGAMIALFGVMVGIGASGWTTYLQVRAARLLAPREQLEHDVRTYSLLLSATQYRNELWTAPRQSGPLAAELVFALMSCSASDSTEIKTLCDKIMDCQLGGMGTPPAQSDIDAAIIELMKTRR